jgi:hypothetical protein
MADDVRSALSGRLHQLSLELREIDSTLKSGAAPELLALQEFRQVLDNARMTAWTVSELLNAVESQKDPAKVLSFLSAERLRRSNQMLKDLSADIDECELTWQTFGIQALFETVSTLQLQLSNLIQEHRNSLEKVGGAVRQAGSPTFRQ